MTGKRPQIFGLSLLLGSLVLSAIEEVMKAVYAPIFPALEARYRATLAECATDSQSRRLESFGHNLTQLHHALQKAGLVEADSGSFFQKDDVAFAQFMKAMETTFSLYADKSGQDHGPVWKGEWSAPAAVPKP